MSSTTAYMLLVLPDVSVTIGPEWASLLNSALQRVDLHDHSDDLGVKVTPAGLNINDDLDFGDNEQTSVGAIGLTALAVGLSTAGRIYRVGDNLFYNNASGVAVQITSGTQLAVPGSGVITATSPSSFPYNVTSGDAQTVLLIDTSVARTINLPAATTTMFFMIKDAVGSSPTNVISVVPDGTDVIDGSNSSLEMDSSWQSIGLVSDGVSKWFIV